MHLLAEIQDDRSLVAPLVDQLAHSRSEDVGLAGVRLEQKLGVTHRSGAACPEDLLRSDVGTGKDVLAEKLLISGEHRRNVVLCHKGHARNKGQQAACDSVS